MGFFVGTQKAMKYCIYANLEKIAKKNDLLS
jgi:hypothetical protein